MLQDTLQRVLLKEQPPKQPPKFIQLEFQPTGSACLGSSGIKRCGPKPWQLQQRWQQSLPGSSCAGFAAHLVLLRRCIYNIIVYVYYIYIYMQNYCIPTMYVIYIYIYCIYICVYWCMHPNIYHIYSYVHWNYRNGRSDHLKTGQLVWVLSSSSCYVSKVLPA